VGAVIILAMETATSACAVGLAGDFGVDVRVVNTERRHGEHLMAGVAALLADHGLTPRDVARVVVDRGPGLFTGLRVGVASALAFAQASGAELVSVTSLEMLAHGAFARGVRGDLVAVVDARRHEVFAQAFNLETDVSALDEAQVMVPAELVERWRGCRVRFSGDGAMRYRDVLEAVGGIEDETVPPLAAALELARELAPTREVAPLYLRDADAVANFTTRQVGR
jgi:tRNA threonylcarbamoyladenosine biosynthesis protein TsaB